MGCVCLRYVNYNLHNSRDFEWGNVLIFTFIIRFLTSKHIKYQRSMHSNSCYSFVLALPTALTQSATEVTTILLNLRCSQIMVTFSFQFAIYFLVFFLNNKNISCFHCFFVFLLKKLINYKFFLTNSLCQQVKYASFDRRILDILRKDKLRF